MLTYIAKRLLLMIPTLFGVLTLTFVLIQFVPGGPVDNLIAEMRAGRYSSGFPPECNFWQGGQMSAGWAAQCTNASMECRRARAAG